MKLRPMVACADEWPMTWYIYIGECSLIIMNKAFFYPGWNLDLWCSKLSATKVLYPGKGSTGF